MTLLAKFFEIVGKGETMMVTNIFSYPFLPIIKTRAVTKCDLIPPPAL